MFANYSRRVEVENVTKELSVLNQHAAVYIGPALLNHSQQRQRQRQRQRQGQRQRRCCCFLLGQPFSITLRHEAPRLVPIALTNLCQILCRVQRLKSLCVVEHIVCLGQFG